MFSIDGSPLDICSFGAAIVACVLHPARQLVRREPVLVDTNKMISVFFSGALLVPFLCLSASVFSDALLAQVVHSNKLILSMGGVAGLFTALREIFGKTLASLPNSRSAADSEC